MQNQAYGPVIEMSGRLSFGEKNSRSKFRCGRGPERTIFLVSDKIEKYRG